MVKKRKVRKGNFLSRVQKTPKMRSLKKKMQKVNSAKKRLSVQYKRLLKSESKRLSR
jgi:hypothetical protein